jgi:predicted outer membrane repeat protein
VTSVPKLASLPRKLGANTVASIVVLAMSFLLASVAHADAVVTLCHRSDESGSGINLENALLAKPDPNSLINTITFQCNGAATIQVPEVFINQPTSIDGGGVITLANDLPGFPFMFVVNGTFFYLNNLILRDHNVPSQRCTDWQHDCGGSVVYGVAVAPTVEFHHSRVENSNIPVVMASGSLGIYDSQFAGNSDIVIVTASGVTTTTIDHSIFQNNPGAAPIEATGSFNLTITNSQFTNNGNMDLEGTCHLTMDRDRFENNGPNGAILTTCDSTISNSIFTNNSSTLPGGAILFGGSASHVVLRADKFLNNSSAANGGAVFFHVPLNTGSRGVSILHSAFQGNKATSGGAIEVGFAVVVPGTRAMTVINVGAASFSRNVATVDGGAIHGQWTELQIARGVFADNKAGGHGGAVALSNPPQLHSNVGNALFVRNNAPAGSAFFGDDADFINSTVDSNVGGTAIMISAPRPPAHIRFLNSLVSNNPQGGCAPAGLFDDATHGHNLQYPAADCGASITVANPHLDTMYIPLPKSPPMGNGDLTVCLKSPINGRDVYGLGRPSGGACTTGAAEGDIQVLVNRRTGKGRAGQCDCGTSLLKQLQRLLPFNR